MEFHPSISCLVLFNPVFPDLRISSLYQGWDSVDIEVLSEVEAMPHSVHPTPRSTTPDPGDVGQLWWNINVPRGQWTSECPEFLVGQGAKNIGILSRSPDADRRRFNWEEVKELASMLAVFI